MLQFNIITVIWLLPALVALVVLRLRKQPWEKTLSLLGWRLGAPIYYLWALLFCLLTAIPLVLLAIFVFPDLYRHPPQGITLYYYAHLGFSFFSIGIAFLNEFFFTALGEEVFFRGLVGGWLMRRCGFLVGNVLQTLIFLLPHLIALVVDVHLWPLLIAPVLLGWINGWLLYKSGSILPGMLVHALGNTFNDVLAMLMI
jgi:membrane protease YdiL (CAAX protease family)